MKITTFLTDKAVLAEIGQRLVQRRLELQLTQAEVADRAGIGKRTLERIEAGHSAQFASLIRIFRALDLLSGLESLIPEATPRPMDLLKRKGKVRRRASRDHRSKPIGKGWVWGDET
ncbi:MAG: helix-turn-helix domain-containing protein [FCB group bacterium]|nr:helix-turn-helix domain-containing protein [FCB group bacterium]